jgi:hypothetical protein
MAFSNCLSVCKSLSCDMQKLVMSCYNAGLLRTLQIPSIDHNIR